MDSVNDVYISVRERIFALLESEAISQRDFAQAIDVVPQTITDWKKGRSTSFMKKLGPIAEALGVTTSELLGESVPFAQVPQETRPMNAKLEIDPALLDDAVEVMRFAVDICEADAAALARLDTPEARELAQARLLMAKRADKLLFFFAGQ